MADTLASKTTQLKWWLLIWDTGRRFFCFVLIKREKQKECHKTNTIRLDLNHVDDSVLPFKEEMNSLVIFIESISKNKRMQDFW